MNLSCKHKCLIKYIFDKCDAAGVFEPNWKLTSLSIGEPVSESDLTVFSEQLEKLKTGKYWVKDFVSFQYGKLSTASPAHKPVFKALEKHSLLHRVSDSLLDRLQETDKEKEKDKEYIAPKDFLKRVNEIQLTNLNMSARISPEDFEEAITQWSLSKIEAGWAYSENESADYQKLIAGFEKWLNSWVRNNREKMTKQDRGIEIKDELYEKLIARKNK